MWNENDNQPNIKTNRKQRKKFKAQTEVKQYRPNQFAQASSATENDQSLARRLNFAQDKDQFEF